MIADQKLQGQTLRVVLGVLAVVFGIGCSAFRDIEVEHAFGAAPLAGFGASFGWLPGPAPKAGDPRVDRPGLDSFIKSTLDAGFEKKGYSKSSTSPDFLLRYMIGTSLGFEKIGPHVLPIDQGTLVVDVVHPASRKVMWRGWARAKLNSENPPDVVKKRVRYALDKLMDRFPDRE